ncbi:hypothetical protein [Sulfurimonas sp.]|uniref:hypothetical protein n=1 Tax=Sulfurimonas sp. TaxID=2022749 RepID=UPI003565F9DF
MLELIIVILLVYVSYKLKQQEKLMREQNSLIESFQEIQTHCREHIKRLEKKFDELTKKE